jgi:hypothetical protein
VSHFVILNEVKNLCFHSLGVFMSKYKWTFVSIAVIALLAGGVSGLSEINFWLIFLVMFGSILFTEIIAALEDDMPGGYNNPDGTDTPKNTKIMS